MRDQGCHHPLFPSLSRTILPGNKEKRAGWGRVRRRDKASKIDDETRSLPAKGAEARAHWTLSINTGALSEPDCLWCFRWRRNAADLRRECGI